MSFVLADRVKETTTSPGTGTATLSGAVTGYQSFSAGIGANNTTYYVIADASGPNWEVGYGTVGAGGTTLARTTVLASSNSGSLVDFSSGTQNVWCDYPAGKAVFLDSTGNISETIANISGVTGGISSPDFVQFDTAATVTRATGKLWWDSADGIQTLNLGMAGTNATLQIGEEMYFRIKCQSAITEGQVVMFAGTVGASGGLLGAPATGLTAATASYIMGVATESGNTNDWIYVTNFGLVRNIDTSGGAESWINGQILYYNPAVTGGLTKTIPSAPNAKVQVAAVVYADASNGSLFIRPSFGGELGQYEGDVQVTTPANGDLLIRNQTSGKWVNAPLTAGTGVSVTNTAGAVTIANTGVTSVSGTSPVASSGGATPAISLASGYGDTQNPYASKTANYFLAAPNGSAGVPTFRAIVAADIPTLNQNTTGSAGSVANALTAGTGISYSSGTTYNGSAAITISIPQAITTTSSVQFGSFGVGTAASGTSGEIRATNNVTAYYSSDIKFKENIKIIDKATDKVISIGGKTFDWTDAYIEDKGGEDGYFIQKADFGVIAQDVQAVFPQAVRTRDDGSLAVDYAKLSALAFAAIAELNERIKVLEAK